jgi:hypothetical protein
MFLLTFILSYNRRRGKRNSVHFSASFSREIAGEGTTSLYTMKKALKRLSAFIKKGIQRSPVLDRAFRLYYVRGIKGWWKGYPDWRYTLAGGWGINGSKNKPKILLATSVGGYLAGVTLESAVGAALKLRGSEVHVLLCDESLPACFECQVSLYPQQEKFLSDGPRDLCRACYGRGNRLFQTMGLTVHTYSDFLTESDRRSARDIAAGLTRDEMAGFVLDGLSVGQHALAGALRFYARATLDGEPNGTEVLRRYFEAALLTVYATRRLLERHRFESAVFSHGIYVPFGLIGEVCRQMSVRVVNWNPAYRKKRFVFSHGGTYHHTLMDEPPSEWESLDLSTEQENELMAYLKSRWHGSEDWIWFHEEPLTSARDIQGRLGIDMSKPTVGMLTNVMWDAQLHYPTNAFKDMREWAVETIRYFAKRPDIQLLIRIHPAEIRGTLRSRQPILEEIRKEFPVLPGNVFVIPPESPVSTYAAMELCQAVIIYGTKTGVELACLGQPIIVAGEAWVRNKGFTLDAKNPTDYREILDRLPFKDGDSPVDRKRARKYAYHFFFRRMIPLEFMEANEGDPPFRLALRNLNELKPGKSLGLDVICDGILKGTPFVYPAELETPLADASARTSASLG